MIYHRLAKLRLDKHDLDMRGLEGVEPSLGQRHEPVDRQLAQRIVGTGSAR